MEPEQRLLKEQRGELARTERPAADHCRLRQCAAMTPERHPQCDFVFWPPTAEEILMRAVTLDAFDAAPAVRDDLPDPTAAAGGLVVRVRASSVNPVDN